MTGERAGAPPAAIRRAVALPLMPFAERQSAAREEAAAVAMDERSPQRRRDRPRARADLHDPPILVVSHDHAARVAREAPRRFQGNAHAALEDRLSRLIRIREHGGIDVDHDLVPLSGRAGVDPVMERALREQRQRVGLLLFHGRKILRRVRGTRRRAGLLV